MTATRAFRQVPHRSETDLVTVLEAHRARVNRVHRVRNAEGLVRMVDAFGFCFAFTHRTGDARIPACIDHLAQHGETQTKRMRADLGITSPEGKADYAKAVEELQRLMYVARVKAVG